MSEINLLQTYAYSKEVLNLNFPLLKEVSSLRDISEQTKDRSGVNRYYVKPVVIRGHRFLLCSQWYEYNREHLVKWIGMYL